MTLQEIVTAVEQLDEEDLEQLLEIVRASLPKHDHDTRNIMELSGLGANIWKGMDVDKYIDEMRDEWDKPKE